MEDRIDAVHCPFVDEEKTKKENGKDNAFDNDNYEDVLIFPFVIVLYI